MKKTAIFCSRYCRKNTTLPVSCLSHDVSALKMLCRETMILEQGTMIERQNTEMLFAHPQQAWTQAFVHAAETRKGGEWTWKAL